MKLFANGCSLTYGDELVDETKGIKEENDKVRLATAWPGQLTKLLQFDDHVNMGNPGGSNHRIVRTTLDYLGNKLDEDWFVVIGWTFPQRTEFKIDDTWRNFLTGWTPYNETEKIVNRVCIQYLFDQIGSHTTTFIHMICLQNWLKLNNIPYLFFSAGPIRWSLDPTHDNLCNQIDNKRYYKFKEKADIGYVLRHHEKNILFGPGHHPLHEGHKIWSEILHDFIVQNNLINI